MFQDDSFLMLSPKICFISPELGPSRHESCRNVVFWGVISINFEARIAPNMGKMAHFPGTSSNGRETPINTAFLLSFFVVSGVANTVCYDYHLMEWLTSEGGG